jgi:hypothetical protein
MYIHMYVSFSLYILQVMYEELNSTLGHQLDIILTDERLVSSTTTEKKKFLYLPRWDLAWWFRDRQLASNAADFLLYRMFSYDREMNSYRDHRGNGFEEEERRVVVIQLRKSSPKLVQFYKEYLMELKQAGVTDDAFGNQDYSRCV